MQLAIGILTIILVLDALFLILLILLQLPKKEAGLGTAFGGGTTDALFGAGAGNVLTKATKWGAILFICLSIALSIMHKSVGEERRNLGGKQPTTNPANTNAPPAPKPPQTNNPVQTVTNNPPTTNSAPTPTNSPPTTNAPPASAPKSKGEPAPAPKGKAAPTPPKN
tara:strand:+ start:157 stop:657 length:501 start_codon:yes stop_codon:yes gene_type:complete